jgi:hypothetical protein
MALLENITYSPTEPIQDMYDKINAAINKINSVLGEGTAGQIPSKINSDDFNTAYVNSILPSSGTPNLKIKVLEIGDWNMDSTATLTVAHGLSDWTKIRSIEVSILNDASGRIYPIAGAADSTTGALSGGYNVGSPNVILYRTPSGIFDGAGFDSTSFNRGWITIIYEG